MWFCAFTQCVQKQSVPSECKHRVSYCGSNKHQPVALQYGVKQRQHTHSGNENTPGYSTPLTYMCRSVKLEDGSGKTIPNPYLSTNHAPVAKNKNAFPRLLHFKNVPNLYPHLRSSPDENYIFSSRISELENYIPHPVPMLLMPFMELRLPPPPPPPLLP